MKKLIKFIIRTIDKALNCNISLYSAESSFFLLISSVPFVLLLLNFAQYVIPFSKDEMIQIASLIIPEALVPPVNSVINEIYTAPTISAVSLTAITTLWSSSRGFFSLVHGLDTIYSGNDTLSFLKQRIYSFFYTFIFIVAIIITLIVIALWNRIIALLMHPFPHLAKTFSIISDIRPWFFIIFLTLFFDSCYTILPKKKLNFIKQIPGALFSAVSWMIFSYVYGIYIEHFSNYSNIYGSLAAVVLFMLWLYFCMNIFMIGAIINVTLSDKV